MQWSSFFDHWPAASLGVDRNRRAEAVAVVCLVAAAEEVGFETYF